jgi:hypothetical protein
MIGKFRDRKFQSLEFVLIATTACLRVKPTLYSAASNFGPTPSAMFSQERRPGKERENES